MTIQALRFQYLTPFGAGHIFQNYNFFCYFLTEDKKAFTYQLVIYINGVLVVLAISLAPFGINTAKDFFALWPAEARLGWCPGLI
jgi:hypothetical protein